MNGIHLLGDFYGCQCKAQLLSNLPMLRQLCKQAVTDAGLTAVQDLFHQFDPISTEEAGITGTVLLAESHLALHTWPELQAVTLDVYVCNFSTDNSAKAHHLFDQLAEAFQATTQSSQTVHRGAVDGTQEALGEASLLGEPT